MFKHSLFFSVILLAALFPVVGSAGGGGDGDGLDVLPCVGPAPGPNFGAVVEPHSLLWDMIEDATLPRWWRIMGPGVDLTLTTSPPCIDSAGLVFQPANVSGIISGNFVNSACTLADCDDRLAIVGPDGQLGIRFYIERDVWPLRYDLYASFDYLELLEDPQDPTDDFCGRLVDLGGTGIPNGPLGMRDLTY